VISVVNGMVIPAYYLNFNALPMAPAYDTNVADSPVATVDQSDDNAKAMGESQKKVIEINQTPVSDYTK